ncbi:hypothetical protein [Streptomyces thermoalcalitolerans]|uniref:Secreted protein n=1 Tax=Streptomyces thermoalcalitolerans TaxID=65605 RepID=A0ABN1NN60_9ACTN
MTTRTWKGIRHLAGGFCAAALLAGTVGAASAEAASQVPKTMAESPSMASHDRCTGYKYDDSGMRTWQPPGCTPP